MNTSYSASDNVFGDGAAGVDLMQAFISMGYSRRVGPVKFGLAPTMAVQRFQAKGLAAFGVGGASVDSAHLTNNGYDYSYGGGIRGGVEFSLTENIRLGVAGQTKMYMSKFDKYSGLFEGGGDFDIPASITAGLAVDVTPDLTFTFDYQHIFYSDVAAVSNSDEQLFSNGILLGANNGPGFRWNDVKVFKAGLEYRVNPDVTLRAGYAYNNNPIESDEILFNILAPGVTKQHITGGVAFNLGNKSTLELSAIHAPESKVSGTSPDVYTEKTTLRMHQYQFMMSVTHKF